MHFPCFLSYYIMEDFIKIYSKMQLHLFQVIISSFFSACVYLQEMCPACTGKCFDLISWGVSAVTASSDDTEWMKENNVFFDYCARAVMSQWCFYDIIMTIKQRIATNKHHLSECKPFTCCTPWRWPGYTPFTCKTTTDINKQNDVFGLP